MYGLIGDRPSAPLNGRCNGRPPARTMTAQSTLAELAKEALETARSRNLTIVTAESCTAGKLATLLSEAPGAADHLHGGSVTYTKAKQDKIAWRLGRIA
jgi:hypothetical protein